MSIEVRGKDNYKWTWDHTPRGYGHWAFQIADEIKFFTGNFGDTQKKALAYARKYHPKVFSIKVLP